jgi:molecular chaperone HtpG
LLDLPQNCRWVVDELHRKNADDLVTRIKMLRDAAEPILSKITETFPNYTIHDVHHSDTVCEILGWLIPKEIISYMTKYDIYFLTAAAYLHDIGMADIKEIFNDGDYTKWLEQSKKEDKSESKMEFIRDSHHERSKDYVMKYFHKFSISNENEAHIIMLISMGHRRLEDLKDVKLYTRNYMYSNNYSINTAALAFFLQIADELDLTFERVPALIYNSFYPENPISKDEWDKAVSVSGIGHDRDDNYCTINGSKNLSVS